MAIQLARELSYDQKFDTQTVTSQDNDLLRKQRDQNTENDAWSDVFDGLYLSFFFKNCINKFFK